MAALKLWYQDFSVKILYYKCGITGDADASSAVYSELFFHVITTNVMFFFHFTSRGFLYCHLSHNILFSNISRYLPNISQYLLNISRLLFNGTSLTFPGLYPVAPRHFPCISLSLSLIS